MQRLNLVVKVNNRMNVIDVKDAVQVRTSYSFISPHKKQNKNKLYNFIYINKYIIYKYILLCSLHAVTSSVCTDIHTEKCNLFVLYNKNSNGLLKVATSAGISKLFGKEARLVLACLDRKLGLLC